MLQSNFQYLLPWVFMSSTRWQIPFFRLFFLPSFSSHQANHCEKINWFSLDHYFYNANTTHEAYLFHLLDSRQGVNLPEAERSFLFTFRTKTAKNYRVLYLALSLAWSCFYRLDKWPFHFYHVVSFFLKVNRCLFKKHHIFTYLWTCNIRVVVLCSFLRFVQVIYCSFGTIGYATHALSTLMFKWWHTVLHFDIMSYANSFAKATGNAVFRYYKMSIFLRQGAHKGLFNSSQYFFS